MARDIMKNGREVTFRRRGWEGGIRHHTKETLSSPYLLKIKVFLGYREDSRWSKGA